MVHFTTSLAAAALFSARFAYAMPMMPMEAAMMPAEMMPKMEASPPAMMHDSAPPAMEAPAMMHETSAAKAMETSPPMHMAPPAMMHETSAAKAMETPMMHEAPPPMMEAPPPMMEHKATSTMAEKAMETPPPMYGSGGMSPEFEKCVAQCTASFPPAAAATMAPPAGHDMATPTKATETAAAGTGVTHTVVVAPSQGVLRYVPFAVNASIGDTVSFQWHANGHTVTKGSALQPCNKSSDPLFAASGLQNSSFIFNQVVNDTAPTYFYCAAPGHCQKGMFGMINPPVVDFGSEKSASAMMAKMSTDNKDMASMASYTSQKTAGNAAAASWGNNMDMSALPEWAYAPMAENIMYTKTYLAANPEIMSDKGIDMSGTTPMMVPADITIAGLNNVAPGPAQAVPNGASGSGSAASPEPTADAAANNVAPGGNLSTSGASSLAAPSVVAFIAVAATFFAL